MPNKMTFEGYLEVFKSEHLSDLLILFFLIKMTDDETGLRLSDAQTDVIRDTVREHHPEAWIMHRAMMLEWFDLGTNRETIAHELELSESASYLDIAREQERVECT
ncbi:MAG: hypothetical protein KC877_05090 [Candidatus Kaiserbacteria bacterium]|nr:hypothetical protein [Candidatus Kaiserbacteria bacterium]MCB9816427.1 hypothetical protein [Candidatus Nomurabacteria bacterium]